MSGFYVFAGVWSFLHGVLLLFCLLEFRLPKKKTVLFSLLFFLPLIALDLWFYGVYGSETGGQALLLIHTIPAFLFCFFISRCRDGRFVFTFFFAKTMSGGIVLLTNLLDVYGTPDTHFMMFLSRLLLYPLAEWLLLRFFRTTYLALQKKMARGWWLLSALAVVFYLVMIVFFNFPETLSERPEELPTFFLLLVSVVLAYVAMFRVVLQQIAIFETGERESLLQIQAEMLKLRLEEFSRAENAGAVYRHDERHRLMTVSEMLRHGETDDAIAYLSASEKALAETAVSHFCENIAVDTVLSVYAAQTARLSIAFDVEVSLPKAEENEREAAFSIVLANALENAVHENEKLPEEKRYIRLRAVDFPKRMLCVENACTDAVTLDENGYPCKKGIGIRSIAAYCEKYGARLSYKITDERLTMTVVSLS